MAQLFGGYEDGMWKEGLLERLLKNAQKQVQAVLEASRVIERNSKATPPTIINKWLVFDGNINSPWMDNLATVIDTNRVLSLANGGHVKVDCKSKFFW